MATSTRVRRPIERRTLTTSVYDHLLKEMLVGMVKPGERIVIDRLAQELGVSITPVREALKRLQSEGLVDEDPYSGMRVSELSADELLQITEARGVLAGYAAQLALGKMTDADLQHLRREFSALARAAKAGEVSGFRKHDQAFHAALYSPSGQLAILDLMEQMRRKVGRYEAVDLIVLDNAYLNTSQEQHGQIMELVERRDGERLETLIRRHAMNFAFEIVKHMRAQSGSAHPRSLGH